MSWIEILKVVSEIKDSVANAIKEKLRPCDIDEILFRMAIESKKWRIVVFLNEILDLKVHEVSIVDGKSAVHFLASERFNHHADVDEENKPLLDWFLKDSEENHCDELGYTYLHGACFIGDTETVRKFVSRGVDVNVDTYTCSPLHVAVKFRRVEVVRVLLENGADPNGLEHDDKSTPLHGLARRRVCDCLERCSDNNEGDERRPVDAIVDLLVAGGANLETRDRRGATPLERAVSLLDLELAKSLLEHGASLDGLNEKLSFGADYTPVELRNYPIILHVVEMIRLLVSKGLILNFYTRFRILKFWMNVRRYDIECSSENEDIYKKCYRKYLWHLFSEHLHMQEKFGFFMKQETVEYLRSRREALKENIGDPSYECPKRLEKWSMEEDIMKNIMLNKDVSIYQLCRMSYARGYSVLEEMKDWRLPLLPGLQLSTGFIKRHVAKILMRPQFELFAADLFMTDHCRLGLPYTACRKVAEHTSDEDLYRLCEQTSEEDLEPALTAQGANVRAPED